MSWYERARIEWQRVYCLTCQRHGRYVFHWHRKHMVGAP